MSRLILVPLDGSEFSESVLDPAIDIARRWDARLEIVTVHEAVPALDHDQWESASREWSEHYIEEVADRIQEETDFKVTATSLNGSPAEAIQHHVLARGVDLVVMGTHGRGPMSRFWLGSTADGLVRHSTVPILLLRPDEDGSGRMSHFELRRVVVPLDGSPEGEAILSHAITLAGDKDTQFDLVRVYPYAKDFSSSYLPHTVQMNTDLLEERRKAAEEYIQAKADELVAKGLCAEGHVVVEENPATGILDFTQRTGADLIAMSTHGRGGVSRLVLGSVTDKVVRGAQIPALVYHPSDLDGEPERTRARGASRERVWAHPTGRDHEQRA
jgi:nucleotide-binding universal stress UspA family protein